MLPLAQALALTQALTLALALALTLSLSRRAADREVVEMVRQHQLLHVSVRYEPGTALARTLVSTRRPTPNPNPNPNHEPGTACLRLLLNRLKACCSPGELSALLDQLDAQGHSALSLACAPSSSAISQVRVRVNPNPNPNP